MASDDAASRSVIADETWWGSFEFDVGMTRCWTIGTLELWIRRAAREWSIAYRRGEEPFSENLVVARPASGGAVVPEEASSLRVVFRATDSSCRLLPVLPDRALVVKPEVPFYVPSGEEIVLYMSSPLWLRIETGDPPQELHSIPTYRPSDTWFGSPTVGGEFCYAGRTRARLDIERVPVLFQRAISTVNVRNLAGNQLALERLRLPLPKLSLYCSADNHLWTEDVTLVREEDGDVAVMSLGNAPPARYPDAKRVTGPREPEESAFLTRAFGGLFDGR